LTTEGRNQAERELGEAKSRESGEVDLNLDNGLLLWGGCSLVHYIRERYYNRISCFECI